MAKNNKVFLRPPLRTTDEAGTFFIYIFFSPQNRWGHFFQVWKKTWGVFETDEGGPEKQLTFFPYLIEIF